MKVLWLTNIPSPYRVKFFNELGKYCDLTVLFEKSASSERDESWKNINNQNFKAIYLKGKSIGVAEAFCPSVTKFLKKGYDHIVVTNYSDLTGIWAILYLKVKKVPYEIEGDGAFPGTGRGIKEKIKRFLLRGAVRYFSSAALHDEYYKRYGIKQEKIVRYPFTSVYEKDVLEKPLSNEEKKDLRDRLSITEEYIVLAVGQFIYRKGYDILLKAFQSLNNSFGLYIIGGNATEEYYKLADGKRNIHFIKFLLPAELSLYYRAADVFVHPTREDIWGLVVNEAMANGLPVITTNKCIAGLEMIKPNTGIIIDSDDVKGLCNAISESKNNSLLNGVKILQIARKYTIEEMVDAHLTAWG